MLKQRLGAAFALIFVFLAALFYLPPLYWALLMTVVALGAAWEWAGLCGISGPRRAMYAVAVGVVIAGFYSLASLWVTQGVWLTALFFWLFLAPLWLIRHWVIKQRVFMLVIGLIVLLPTWLAFVQLRAINPQFLLFLMGLIWLADSAAYFAGRQWGKHKLAPRISPGKTWEGVVGALVVAIVYVALWRLIAPETFTRFPAVSWLGQSAIAVFLVAISITGDLFESHLKRIAGLKDSGTLIPGHGGILDRIDSQTSVLPVAMAIIYFYGLNP